MTSLSAHTESLLRERKTFFFHLLFSSLEGILGGIVLLNEFVFSKSLEASEYKVSALIQLSTITLIFSIFFIEFSRKVADKKKWLQRLALFTRLPLVLFLLFPSQIGLLRGHPYYQLFFLFIFGLYFFAPPILFPLINQILKGNYRKERMGKLYGYATTVNMLFILLSSYSFGFLLDRNETNFLYVYPVMGILGTLSIFLLTRLDENKTDSLEPVSITDLHSLVKAPLWRALEILKRDTGYRHFEIGFMIYGMSFMMSIVVVVVLLTDVFHLSYAHIAIYKGVPLFLALFLLPYFGSLMDKMDPRRFAQLTYFFILLYFVFLIISYRLPLSAQIGTFKVYYFLLIAYMGFGLFSASMTILWNIGSTYFCTSQEAASYQAIHLTLTGLRGLIGPALGVVLLKYFGFIGAFFCSIIGLALAILLMEYSVKTLSLVPVQETSHSQ